MKSNQIPLKLFSLEGRYASALYNFSSKNNNIIQVEEELKRLKEVIDSSDTLNRFLNDPSQNRVSKKEKFLDLMDKLKFSTTIQKISSIIATNGRLSLFNKIINDYGLIMMAGRNNVSVTITSAKDLPENIISSLKLTIKSKFLKPEQTSSINLVVDPNIIGGIILQIGDKTIDLSTSSKIIQIDKNIHDKYI